MRYTGHLDLHQTWERTFRRARLPLAYSQGFHPQPRINLAAALPLGFTSECEVVDAWLENELPLDEVEAALRRAAPPGIAIQQVERAEERAPALQTQVTAAEYHITLLEAIADLPERVTQLMASSELPRERRGKPYNLRPLVEALAAGTPGEAGQPDLTATLAAREGATGRPEEVLDALGIPPETARVHRTRLFFAG